MINEFNTVESINDIKEGSILVIKRKRDNRRIIVKCCGIARGNEVLLSKSKNDYFNFDMHRQGKSWVWRVWVLPEDIELTTITNNMNEFPR